MPLAVQAAARIIPKVVKALRPALCCCYERTATVMARWGMTGGPKEIGKSCSSLREREVRLGLPLLGQRLLGRGLSRKRVEFLD
jgi:hypothetical protein